MRSKKLETMDSEGKHGPLEIFFIPLIARGHMIPMLGLANFLADNGVRATIVTTPSNASFLRRAVDAAAESGRYLRLLTVPFPVVDGLPPGCETAFDLPPGVDKMKIFQAMQLLQEPVEQLLREHRPDCLVGDITVPWTAAVAESIDIPHVQFALFSAFSDVVINNLVCGAAETDEVVPGIPHRIEMKRSELPEIFSLLHADNMSNRSKSIGIIFNTFFELEPDYVELVKGFTKGRMWCAGPLHLLGVNKGNNNHNNWDRFKNWLDTKDPESVLYVNFGSECCFGEDQLREIANGLDSSGQPFIWVVRGGGGGGDTIEDWLPLGFRENVGGRGLVLTEWVPQAAILAHPAVGGYVVHCGWNSSIEAFGAGLPVITWPLQSDQFINERLFVEVNGTGVRSSDGGKSGLVGRQKVREAVSRLFGVGDEAKERRRKAKEYGELARAAVVEGGSSYADLTSFLEDLTVIVQKKKAALHA